MRKLVLVGMAVALVRLTCGGCADDGDGGETLRLGTFNIRFFPEDTADLEATAARIAELDADAFAVQEIIDPAVLAKVAGEAGRATGREYAVTVGRYCSATREWYLGVVYDQRRVKLVDSLSLTSRERCRAGHPSMHVAVLERAGRRVALAAVHLKAGGELRSHYERRRQWLHVLVTQQRLERRLGAPVVIAGDYNTTGFTDNEVGERRYIETVSRAAGLEVLTRDLACTAYWRPEAETYAPSVLDHMIAREPDRFGPARVLGYCRELACEPVRGRPVEHRTVSDHCPVAIDYRL